MSKPWPADDPLAFFRQKIAAPDLFALLLSVDFSLGGPMRAMRRSLMFAAFLAMANVVPALAGAQCGPLTMLTSMDMNPSADVPIVTAMIGDKPVGLLVDTGGSLSSLTKRAVRELNLQTGQSRIQLRNVAGQEENLEARLPSITLGRLRQEGAYFMVLPGPEDPMGPTIEEFGGILGSEMLRNVDVDFDFAANKLNLVSPDHCAGNVVYWQAPAVAVVPMTLNATGHIMFRMELDGRRVNTMLDTGFSNTTLNLDTARRVLRIDVNAPDVEKIGELTGGYTASAYRRRFKTLSVDGVTISNPMIDILPNMMGSVSPDAPRTGSIIREQQNGLPDLILGMSTMSQMHVYIAYKERKLYFTAAAPQAPQQ
jgi:predicted aspartyl protease